MDTNFLKTNISKIGIIDPKKSFFWLKLWALTGAVYAIFVFLFAIVVKFNIFVPGIFVFIQIMVPYVFNEGDGLFMSFWNGKTLFYFVVGSLVGVVLLFWAYHWINKNYAIRMIPGIFFWFVGGLIISINTIDIELANFGKIIFDSQLSYSDGETNEIYGTVEYYIFAVIIGGIIGILNSIIWRNDTPSGGISAIYAYISIKYKKSFTSSAWKINLLFAAVAIGIMNIVVFIGDNTQPVIKLFILQLVASVILAQSTAFMINWTYPKFELVSVVVVTNTKRNLIKHLRKRYHREGVVVSNGTSFDLKKEKQLVVTTMSYLEVEDFQQLVYRHDPDAFITVTDVKEIHGMYNYF